MTYLGDASGELSLDQLRYHGLLPASTNQEENTLSTTDTTKDAIQRAEAARYADRLTDAEVRTVLDSQQNWRAALDKMQVPPHPEPNCRGAANGMFGLEDGDVCIHADIANEVARRKLALDADPCSDCGALIPVAAPAYAIDCGGICAPCAQTRYGDRASEYLIA